jgi:hypothetical protein
MPVIEQTQAHGLEESSKEETLLATFVFHKTGSIIYKHNYMHGY